MRGIIMIAALTIITATQVQAQPGGGCAAGCVPRTLTPSEDAHAKLLNEIYAECHRRWGEGPICSSYSSENLVRIFRYGDWSQVGK